MKLTGVFSVAFDPLDGFSILDRNFTVGTIFGVWPGDKLIGVTGRGQFAAATGFCDRDDIITYVLALQNFPALEKVITSLDERTQVAYGSKNEIIRFEETLYGSSRLRGNVLVVATAYAANDVGNGKWHGSVSGIVRAPIDKVWPLVSQTKRLPEWMPMVERCTALAGDEDEPGYVRLVSGFMFPQQDGDRSWIKERLVSLDSLAHSYVYRMEACNVGLDGSVNSLKLVEYGDNSTLIRWSFEINPLEDVSEYSLVDYLGFVYKSCINRIEGAIEAASRNV